MLIRLAIYLRREFYIWRALRAERAQGPAGNAAYLLDEAYKYDA